MDPTKTRFRAWESLVHDLNTAAAYLGDFRQEEITEKKRSDEERAQARQANRDTFEMAEEITITSLVNGNNRIG